MNESDTAASLAAFFACCPEMLFVAGVDGTVLHASDALRRALGSSWEKASPLSSLIHPEDGGALSAAWARLAQGTEPVQFDLRVRDAAGGYRQLTFNARRSQDGGLVHGALREAQGGALAELTLKGQLLDSLADHLPVCICAIDQEGKFLYFDGLGLERAGLSRGKYVGGNIHELYAGQGSLVHVQRALSGEAVHFFETVHDAQWESWLVPVKDRERGLLVLGFTLDVSEARKAEDELRARLEQIEKQQEVIRNLATPIIEVWNGVLTLPMVGVVDSVRTADVMDSLLGRIVEKQARFAILDLTGVEIVDTKVASHLIQLITAIRLLGAEGIVAGIKPNVAQTMVALGLDLTQITTQRNLRAALGYCIRRMTPTVTASPDAGGQRA